MSTPVQTLAEAVILVRHYLSEAGYVVTARGQGFTGYLDVARIGKQPGHSSEEVQVRIGQARSGVRFYGSSHEERPDQVVVTGRRVGRARYGWGDKSKVYLRRDDRTFNLDGIKAGVASMFVLLDEAAASQKAAAEDSARRDQVREQSKKALAEAGVPQFGFVGQEGSRLSVSLTSSGDVELKTVLPLADALAMLRKLEVIK